MVKYTDVYYLKDIAVANAVALLTD